ncbi:MAG: creatininase family protein [Halobacteriales archaeon]
METVAVFSMVDTANYRLANGTWEDAAESIESADFVALPTGSHEQHSIHLPLSVDTLLAEYITTRLVETAPEYDLDMVMLPELPYGYSEHHMNYPGTVTLSAETYQRVIQDIGTSMKRHGAARLLIINHHGGNTEPLKLAADRLQRDQELSTHVVSPPSFVSDAIDDHFGDEWGHAGDYETSGIEHIAPELVKQEKKEPQTRVGEFETRTWAYFDDTTEQGGWGDPTNSDPEFFETLVEEMTADILESLNADIDEE